MTKRATVVAVAKRDYAETVFKFANGKVITINPAKLAAKTREDATVHGIVQKVVDAAALSRDPETGKPATVEEKYEACKAIVERLTSGGPWNEKNAGPRGVLFRALCEAYPAKTPDQLAEFLKGKTVSEKEALKRNPKLKPIVDRMMAEAATGDGEDLLDELNEEGEGE